jgi:hypothetical protein
MRSHLVVIVLPDCQYLTGMCSALCVHTAQTREVDFAILPWPKKGASSPSEPRVLVFSIKKVF